MLAHIKEMIEINPAVKLQKGKSYPLIDIDKIIPGIRSVCSKELITYQGQSGCKFQNGDTLMARITPCLENGKIAQAKIDADAGIGSTELFVFRNRKDKTDGKWVYYFISSPYVRLSAINSMTGASGRQRADKFFIERLKFDFPDLPTQEKIASILSAYDDAIENNNKRIKILEKMAENLYREWFVRMRFPGHETAEYENGLPKGWKRTTVEALSSVLKRGISPEYSEVASSRVINQKCIRSSIMDITESRFQIKEFYQELNLIDGDTVICSTGTGTLGRVGQIFGNYPNTTFDSHITMVRAKKGVGREYLYHTLKNLQPWFMSMGIGSTNQQELYRSTIKNAKVVFPSADLEKQFEHISRSFHQEITILLDQTSVLRKQREMLLPRLMSNEVMRLI